MNFKINESEQKLRGCYYTPFPIATFLTKWAFNKNIKRVLEPSCGDGIFLDSILKIIDKKQKNITIDAVELLYPELKKARNKAKLLTEKGFSVNTYNTDFLEWVSLNKNMFWDAIIGNPPYIRYQYFEKDQRECAKEIFEKANVPFSERTNAWVPFVIASVMRLNPGGRLAMVVPSEILYLLHSDGLRRLLEQEMEEIVIVHIKELVFKDVLQGVVLLLGVKRADREFIPLCHDFPGSEKTKLTILEICSLNGLTSLNITHKTSDLIKSHFNGKWMKGLLSKNELDICVKLERKQLVKKFKEIADVDIGIVTGANDFFVVNKKTLDQYKLSRFASPMLAKSNLIKGFVYTHRDHIKNVRDGKPVFFLNFDKYDPKSNSNDVEKYLKVGISEKLPKRYKCSIRDPWYKVPYIWKSEISMLKRCHTFPRLVLNKLRALSTDTAYRIRMKPKYQKRNKDFVFSFINSLTFLYAELEGRHYGGGVLELVPSEIEELYVPLYKCTDAQFNRVDQMIRDKVDVDKLLDYTDKLILPTYGFSNTDIKIIRSAWRRLQKRRHRI